MLVKFLLEKPTRFNTKKAFADLNNKLNKNKKFTKKQKLIKIRDTINKSQNVSINNLKDSQKTLNKWWKDRYLPGQTTVMGRKYLKSKIKEGVNLITKRTIEHQTKINFLDKLIRREREHGTSN